jgi:uncharacterized protein (DUF1697 family)
MTVFVSLLRAINVGGRGTIRMTALADLYRAQGFDSVTTVLQSGSVVFSTRLRSAARIADMIGEAIEEAFGFRPVVVTRTADQLREIIARNPFADRTDVAPGRLLVMFLDGTPAKGGGKALAAAYQGAEDVHLRGSEVFIHYVNGIGRSKLTGAVLERALGVKGTARNWNTVSKLAEVADRIEGR